MLGQDRRRSRAPGESHPKKRRSPRDQEPLKKAFLEAFKRTGTILSAAETADVDRAQVRRWRKDPAFERRFQDADEAITELLERSAMAKALRDDGTVMNIFLLKARRPRIYNDRQRIEMSGPDGQPLTVQIISYAQIEKPA